MKVLALSVLLALGAQSVALEAQSCSFPEYYPLEVGHSWTYVNTTDPNDFSFWDVLIPFPYGGSTISVKVGPDLNNCFIASNDGTTFKFYATVESGVTMDIVPDVCIGTIPDGFAFDTDPSQLVVIRKWSALDHNLTGAYGIDPALTDVLLMVYYDKSFTPNSQNTVVESGAGATSYPYGVTDICFLQRYRGPLALVGVKAENGLLDGIYAAIASFDCNGNLVPDHRDISSGTSLDADGDGIPDECLLGGATPRNGTCATNMGGYLAEGPSLGKSWSASIDNTSTGNNFAQVVGYASPLDFCIGLGALLVNVGDPAGELLALLPTAGVGVVDFEAIVPPITSLIGLTVFTQGVSFSVPGSLDLTLRNGYDLVIGY